MPLLWLTGVKAQSVHLAVPEGYIVAELAKKEITVGQHAERWYYWVRTQQLFSTQGGAAGTVLHGAFTAYYPSGGLKEKGRFRMGLKHGEWSAWDMSGRLRSREHWRSGQLHGTVQCFDEKGAVIEENNYRNGQVKSPRPERVRQTKPKVDKERTKLKERKTEEPVRERPPRKVKKPRAVSDKDPSS